MPANPDGRAAKPPGGGNFSHTLGDMGDVAPFDSEAPMRFLEDGRMRLVAPGLLGCDNHLEFYPELLKCCGEQVVVDVRDDGKPVSVPESP